MLRTKMRRPRKREIENALAGLEESLKFCKNEKLIYSKCLIEGKINALQWVLGIEKKETN